MSAIHPKSLPRYLSVFAALGLSLGACGGDSANADPAPPTDAGVASDSTFGGDAPTDAGDPDIEESDVGTTPDAPPIIPAAPAPDWVELSLQGGEIARGELVATYQRALWWDSPGAGFTYALFDPAGFAAWPDDHSMRFIDSSEVLSIEPTAGPMGAKTFRDHLRAEGIVLEQSPLSGSAQVFTGHESYHLEENGYGDFAWDLVQTDDDGQRFTGDGSQNEDYRIYGADVYLPTGGTVVEVARDWPDNVPGEPDRALPNNLVGVHLGGNYYVYLLHFQPGSIPDSVVEDVPMARGARLGAVGNSGVSAEPHLHVTLYYYTENTLEPRAWSILGEFTDLFTAPSPAGPWILSEAIDPPPKHWISSTPPE